MSKICNSATESFSWRKNTIFAGTKYKNAMRLQLLIFQIVIIYACIHVSTYSQY